MSRVLLVTGDPEYDARFRKAVQGRLPGEVQTVIDPSLPATPDQMLGRSVGEMPTVVVFGPGLDPHAAMRLAGVFDIQRPEISLVLVVPSDMSLAIAALRAGFRDVLDQAADPDGILGVLSRVCDAADSRRRAVPHGSLPGGAPHVDPPALRDDSRIIVVTSPKGGVGIDRSRGRAGGLRPTPRRGLSRSAGSLPARAATVPASCTRRCCGRAAAGIHPSLSPIHRESPCPSRVRAATGLVKERQLRMSHCAEPLRQYVARS